MRSEHELLLSKIIFGSVYIKIKRNEYLYKKADKCIQYKADRIYEKTIYDNLYKDWLLLDQTERVLVENGLWDFQYNKALKDLEKKIEMLKVDLYNNFMNQKVKKDFKNKLKFTRREQNRLLEIKRSLDPNTLEAYAARLRNEFLIMSSLYDKNNKLVFQNKAKKTDSNFMNAVVSEISKTIPDINRIKELARSDVWKSYWSAGDKINLFEGNSLEWTDEQRALVNLTKMYDSIQEHPDCPSDDVIEDDDALDGWMIIQKRKRDSEKKQNKVKPILDKHKNASEIYIVAQAAEEIQEIQELNSPESKQAIRMREKAIEQSKSGAVDEVALPDIQQDMRNKLNQRPSNTRK